MTNVVQNGPCSSSWCGEMRRVEACGRGHGRSRASSSLMCCTHWSAAVNRPGREEGVLGGSMSAANISSERERANKRQVNGTAYRP
jgi:hypothetical protein